MKLETSDNQVVDVDDQIVNMFTVMKTMLQDLGGDVADENPIKIQVDAKVLQQVIRWCEHHKADAAEDAQSTSSSESSDDDDDEDEVYEDREQFKREKKYDIDLDPWDENFLKELDPDDEDAIFPLILAANFLDVPRLLDICCKYVAGIIRGRTPQWIRKRFKLKCDFTEEQKAKIREELAWYDDNIKISDDEEPPKQEAEAAQE